MLKKKDFYKVGDIRKTHGVKGEMMLISDTPIIISDESQWLFFNLDECLVPFKIDNLRHTADTTLLFTCQDIEAVEVAAKYVGVEVFLPLSERSEDADLDSPLSLIGYSVYTEEDDTEFGKIVDFIESTLNPLLEIEHKGENILLPFNEEFILGLEDDKLYVKIPEGLLDL